MENEFKEEIEALETLKEYNVKVIKALNEIIPELKGEKKEDTDEYLQHIFKGINWEIQVLNGTMKYLNRKEELISKEKVNNTIVKLNDAMNAEDTREVAEVVEMELLPFLSGLNENIEKAGRQNSAYIKEEREEQIERWYDYLFFLKY